MKKCLECYSSDNRATPLLNRDDCLLNHTQYICGTCGRCICIEADKTRHLQRWHFPFKSIEIAKLYLRTADVSSKTNCGIYEVISESGRVSYKIFPTEEEYITYLKKSKKTTTNWKPLFQKNEFSNFPDTNIRKLSRQEVAEYLD